MSRVRSLLLQRIPFATALAVALVSGTVLGGAAFEAINPAFDRIVWLEHEAAGGAGGDVVVRRALFSDGRFLTLSPDGYVAGVVDRNLTTELFATVRAGATGWRPAYDAEGLVGERVELAFEGARTASVAVANPGMNFDLPADLARVLRLLTVADRSSAAVEFTPSSLRFTAVPDAAADGTPIDSLPPDFPLAAAREPGGVVVGGAALAALKSSWRDLDDRFDPGVAHRLVTVDGQTWRISWQLDLDAIGALESVEVPS